MGRYLTFEYLSSNSFNYMKMNAQNKLNLSEKKHFTSEKYIKVFLSHRHSEDTDLIKWVQGFFISMNANVYIDWLDESMPEITSSETAEKLKGAIKNSEKFVVLATPKSIESIWIPWEIGLADQIKGLSNIAILPIVHEGSNWEKREYYSLYSRIEKPSNDWIVLKPGFDYSGIPLKEWLHDTRR